MGFLLKAVMPTSRYQGNLHMFSLNHKSIQMRPKAHLRHRLLLSDWKAESFSSSLLFILEEWSCYLVKADHKPITVHPPAIKSPQHTKETDPIYVCSLCLRQRFRRLLKLWPRWCVSEVVILRRETSPVPTRVSTITQQMSLSTPKWWSWL